MHYPTNKIRHDYWQFLPHTVATGCTCSPSPPVDFVWKTMLCALQSACALGRSCANPINVHVAPKLLSKVPMDLHADVASEDYLVTKPSTTLSGVHWVEPTSPQSRNHRSCPI